MAGGRRGAGGGRAAARAIAAGAGLARPFSLRAGHLGAVLRTRLAQDLAAEASAGRLALWLPAAYAAGILAYFGAAQEPSLIAVLGLAGGLAVAAILARRRAVAFAVLVAAMTAAAGFATGTVRTALIDHAVLAKPPAGAVPLSGFIERVERRPAGDRILLRLDSGPVRGLDPVPQLVRLSLRRGYAPPVGTHVTQLARLLPPLGAAMPGAHDFGRAPWFRGIGAIGYGLGRPKATPGGEPPLAVRVAVMVDGVREGLSRRIRAVLSGTPAAIAIALVAGDRSAIPVQVEESMRVSGLTHILSISGLHMALVAGTLFALVRAGLALIPGAALGWPIKSIAAAIALAGSAAYLALSGNDVPAQRSFVMTALVLTGVLAGRPALTLRTVGVAAFVVLALKPEAALDPGTQMSFAATLALVAAYERLRPLRAVPRPDGVAGQALTWLVLLVGGTALTSLVAGLATAPYGIFHFQRIAPYGLAANIAAMPAVTFLVMPAGLAGVLLMPFGWDHLAWPVMGLGIDIMVAVSDRIAGWPGADVRVEALSPATLGFLSLALAAICLLRGVLGAALGIPLALAALLAGPEPRPDVLIAPDAQAVAVRGLDGRFSIIGARGQKLLVEQWLTREGDRRSGSDRSLAAGFMCDRDGCTAPLPGGGTIAVSRRPESLEADCLEARIVVTQHPAPAGCPARVVTPADLSRTGPLAFFLREGGLRERPTRPAHVQRPWMPPLPPLRAGDDGADDVEADPRSE